MASMVAADVCSEQLPSTSYSVATSGPYRNNDAHLRAIKNEQDDADALFAIELLPAELHLHILKNLPRVDIDNCKIVCKRWKEMIYSNSHSLRKHVVDSLTLSALKSRFSLVLKCPSFAKKWTFAERHERGKRRYLLHDERCMKMPHMIIYDEHTSQATDSSSSISLMVPTYAGDAELSVVHDERKKCEHTPPQTLIDKIAKHFGHAHVKTLRFRDLRLTDRFVENLATAFGEQKIRCKTFEIALCKLKYISVASFERLVDMVECERLSLMWLRENDEHISNSSAFIALIARHRSLCIFSITPEIPIGDDQFLERFLDSSCAKKILRLDACRITNSGLLAAIRRWNESAQPWTMNICVISELLDYDRLLLDAVSEISPSSSDDDTSFRIAHPRHTTNRLQLWNDELGCHLVTKFHS